MNANEKISQLDLSSLKIITYGDPRLAEPCSPIDEIDDAVRALADRMFEIMFTSGGVGLAAPQVGATVRLFVASPTASPEDKKAYVNPRIVSQDGGETLEEGCLSVPGVRGKIKRYKTVTIEAQDLTGRTFTETGRGVLARIFQHEMDHLDGRVIVDRMGSVARMAHRRRLADLAAEHRGDETPER